MTSRVATLAVLLGADGSGKTSALAQLRAQKPELTITSIDPADIYPIPGLEHMNWALEVHPRQYAARMGPLSRASFLAHTLSLMYEERLWPALADGGVVICDSYHYRVRAKEHALGSAGAAILDATAETMRVPDLIIWLDVPIEHAWQRNGQACNFYESIGEPSWEGFKLMQEKVLDLVLTQYVADLPMVRVDGSKPVGEVRSDLMAIVGDLLLDQRGCGSLG